MRPLVFDGVGTIVARNLDGTIKYVEDKVTKVTLQLQFDWQAVMGGDSGYAFHYTAGDLKDKVSIEVPRYSAAIADMSQGGKTEKKEIVFDETETNQASKQASSNRTPIKRSNDQTIEA